MAIHLHSFLEFPRLHQLTPTAHKHSPNIKLENDVPGRYPHCEEENTVDQRTVHAPDICGITYPILEVSHPL